MELMGGRPTWARCAAGTALAALLLFGAGCKGKSKTEIADKPLVVATTTMIADLAEQIGGEDVRVIGIMRPGEDPHIYDPRPRDAVEIGKANLVLSNGLHLEGTLHAIIENNLRKDALHVKLAEDPDIAPRESQQFKGAPDPHCWLDVVYFKTYAKNARDALKKIDPGHAADYDARAEAYLNELDELDAYVRKRMAEIPEKSRVLVTSHDAFQYFGNEYGVRVMAIIGVSTEEEARPQQVEALIREIKDNEVKAVFFETSVSANLNNLVEKVSQKTGARVGGTLFSDSLAGPGSPAETYLGMVKFNVDTITDALK